MSAPTALAHLSTRSLDGMRTRLLPAGRAWCVFDGEHLAADTTLAADLSALLRPIAVRVFPCAAPAFLDLVSAPERLAQRTAVAVLRSADGGVGGMVSYVSGEWGGDRCFYAASAFIEPEEQGAGVVASGYGMLMRSELVRAPLRPMWAVVRTPNPVAYAAWRHGGRKMGHVVEPRLDLSVSEDARQVAVATAQANGFGDRIDPRTLVVHGAYEGAILPGGAGPYGARPRSGDAALDALFDRLLGPEDAMLVLGKMSLHRAAAFAGDRVIRQRLGRLGGRRRGAITAPSVGTHVRVRGAERRRPSDRRADDRRSDERRALDRRALDRREHDRRAGERRERPTGPQGAIESGPSGRQPHTVPHETGRTERCEVPAARPPSAAERRELADRRTGDRRIEPRRAVQRRGPERRDLDRRGGPRRQAADRREGSPPA